MGTAPEKHVAVVTGGGRGIGRAVCLRLAAHGCRVAAVARTESELLSTVAAAGPHSNAIVPVVADVTNDAAITTAMTGIADTLGPVTILVNNAGFATPRRSIVDSAVADWDRTLATCLRATMVCTRLVLPSMLERGSGIIVNLASIAAKRGRAGEAAYCAAKFGVLGFTQALYEEVARRGIKVSAVCPGFVDTGFIPAGAKIDRSRLLTPDDVAEVVWQVVVSPTHVCPREIVVEPQHIPGHL